MRILTDFHIFPNSTGLQSQVRFNRVPEKVPEKLPEKVWEALVQSQVRFNKVPEKVPEKLWGTKASGNRLRNLLQNILRNSVEPHLALLQSLEPSPDPRKLIQFVFNSVS